MSTSALRLIDSVLNAIDSKGQACLLRIAKQMLSCSGCTLLVWLLIALIICCVLAFPAVVGLHCLLPYTCMACCCVLERWVCELGSKAV